MGNDSYNRFDFLFTFVVILCHNGLFQKRTYEGGM